MDNFELKAVLVTALILMGIAIVAINFSMI
jgi:hypothetical protein